MLLKEANEVIRRALLSAYFEPELQKLGYSASEIVHPESGAKGLSKDDVLVLYFDIQTGSEYPDGDEWVIVEYLIPYELSLPDSLKSPDYFSRVSVGEGRVNWRHRELVRYRQGRVKRLDDALAFIDRKAGELLGLLEELSLVEEIKRRKAEEGTG